MDLIYIRFTLTNKKRLKFIFKIIKIEISLTFQNVKISKNVKILTCPLGQGTVLVFSECN